MLTVSELAKDLGVSVQTIYRVLNSVKQFEKECLTKKIKGVGYFTEFGERIIRERLTPVKQNSDDCLTVLNSVKQSENEEILFLREQNKALLQELEKEREHNRASLEREREHGRQQAERIAELAEKITELTRNSQVLLKQEQDKNSFLLPENQQSTTKIKNEPRKSGFFGKIFNRKVNL